MAISRNSRKQEENELWNFLVEPKREILDMCHFSKIEKKYRWNQYQKVLLLIPVNQFSYSVTSRKTEHKNYCSKLQNEFHQVRQSGSSCWP